MREILFRGIDKGTNEWVYGYYCESPSPFHKGKEYSIFDDKTILKYSVIPETVGQYTGLTDKHGTKIFEGDIIKEEYSLNGKERGVISVIEYGIVYAYFNGIGVCQRFGDGSGTSMLSVGYDSGVVYCEVIGNIHDNPELLKGGAE